MRKDATQRVVLGGVAVCLVAAITIVAYGSFLKYLIRTWQVDPFYEQGPWILGLAVVLYLRFIYRHYASAAPHLNKNRLYGVGGAFLAAGTLFLSGMLTHLPFLMGMSMVSWMLTVHFLFFHEAQWKSVSFPILYFLCAVPLPYLGELSGLLQFLVARLSSALFNALGYAITQEGINLYLPKASFQIAADCTGIKSWLALMSLCIFFSVFIKTSLLKKLLILLCVMPIAFISNFIRVQLLLLLGYYKGQETALHYWHTFAGASFYILACILVVLTGIGIIRYGRKK